MKSKKTEPKQKRTRTKKTAGPVTGYWRVFGQVHIVKPATAARPGTRKAVKLLEYVKTETLDVAQEISAALMDRVKKSPYCERVEVWSTGAVTKDYYEAAIKPVDSEETNYSQLLQAELFPREEIEGKREIAEAAPAAPDVAGVPTSQPEATALGTAAQAQEARESTPCETMDPVSGARCGGLALYTGEDGKRYCAACWPMRPDAEKVGDVCPNCMVPYADRHSSCESCERLKAKPNACALITRDDLPGSDLAPGQVAE